MTKEQIDRWWDYWHIWRMCDRRPESFIIMANWTGPLPKSMIDTFLELDLYYSKMEATFLEQEAKKEKNKHGR